MIPIVLASILVVAIVVQAVRPAQRLLVVLAGAALACTVSTTAGLGTTRDVFAEVPWDVIIILAGLGALSEVFATTGVFGVVAARLSQWSRGDLRRVLVLSALLMYVVSGLVNNLTALLLVLPVLLILLNLLGVTQRYVTWTLGVMLVACNLGGAATPIGDFPAVLLLGRRVMSFPEYLVIAAPATAIALALLLVYVLVRVRPERGLVREPIATRLSLAVMESIHRNIRVDRRHFVPAMIGLGAMLVAWVTIPASSGIGPELICWIGVGAVLATMPRVGEVILRKRFDAEAVMFLIALFVMVGAVRRSGVFVDLANGLGALDISPSLQLVLFLLVAGLVTGLFSAGPSMAALLDVAQVLATRLPPTAVYVGLALSVCAGSSLLLTAATSGPMAQILTERARIHDPEGNPIRFGFLEFLPVGIRAYLFIQGVAIAYALMLVFGERIF
jgi:Na+/H+ antiporter NhaD/arsenite permease-like protein